MKVLVRALCCAAALVLAQAPTLAQIGWSVTDRNQDSSGLTQLVYRFDINSGDSELIQEFPSRTEQEGLFSTGGSNLFGYSEYDFNLTGTESQQPGVRFIPYGPNGIAGNVLGSGLIGGPNPAPGTQGNVVNPICTMAGARLGTEAGAGYNPTDGFVYVVNSNDNPADGVVGSWFSRFKPNCVSFERLGAGTATTPDNALYVDGTAVDSNGQIYMSDLRLQDRVYRFAPPATLINCNIFNLGVINRDSGLSWDFENNRLIALAENGVLYQVGLPGNPCTGGWTQLSTLSAGGVTPAGDFEGFDIPAFDPID